MSHSSKTFYNPGSGFYVVVITRVLCRFKRIVLGRKTINLPYERTTALRLTASESYERRRVKGISEEKNQGQSA